MAKKSKKAERGNMVSTTVVKHKCKDCQAEYEATKVEWENGDIVISPPRCPACQTAHLTNLRVNHTIKDMHLIGNLKARLTPEQRQAVIETLSQKLTETIDRLSGTVIQQTAFDLKRA